ncbi:MAG TPA: hypothetical protein VD768_08890 [Sphingomicrobium sp.]|nr:hypothetical protein [Sphingomicrobium sp.]
MSKALGVVSMIASVAALIPGPHQGVARVVATVASIGAAITAKPPPARGSANNVQIGANMPTPYTVGRTYIGGNMVHDVGYGGSTNPYRSMVFVWSGGGRTEAIEAFQADFSTISFSGGNAVGFYKDFLYLSTSLGAMPQATALAGPFGAIPNWGATAKISGKTHGLVTLKFDKKGKKFASGMPQFGVILKGEHAYDPRKDSTYPGGSGSHRWDDESTWEWTDNPGLHGLTYARGRYHNGRKVFGCGFAKESINIAAFVQFANLCDANGWKVGGTIYEPGSKWNNLKYLLQAGGAEPLFVGARLSVKYNAPLVALDTITAADLADGDYVVPAMRSWRDRLNSIVPKYRSATHKWEYVQADAVTVEAYVEEDGEEKQEERQFDLVQDKDQAAQLAAYELVNGREFGPIVLPVKPRLAAYVPGEALEIDIPELGLEGQLATIIARRVDPGTAIVELTMMSETTGKHAFALGQSGSAPPTPSLLSSEEIDEIVSSNAYRSTPHVVADEASMLALDVAEGEVAIRTDTEQTFIHNGGTTGTIADWTEAPSPTATAATVTFSPAGSVAATDVQGAIEELATEKAALAGAAFTGPCSVTASGTANAQIQLLDSQATLSGSASGGRLLMGASGATPSASGQRLACFFGQGRSSSANVVSVAGLGIFAAEGWSGTAQGTYMTFEVTASGTTSRAEKARLSGAAFNLASGMVYQIAGTQVLGARRTGWSAATGTATRTSFDTATVTTAQLAERFKALTDDLLAHGLIGA